ncbi:hypothetical protein D3C81_1157390 [compost metagenome]
MIREAYEETGLIVEPERIIGVYGGEAHRYTYGNGHQVEYLTIVFGCRVKDGELNPDNEEMMDLEYFSEHQLPPLSNNNFPKSIFSSNHEERSHFERGLLGSD